MRITLDFCCSFLEKIKMTYNTETRVKIIELLRTNKESFSAEEIFSALSGGGASKSTVFRQLAKLTKTLKLRELRVKIAVP